MSKEPMSRRIIRPTNQSSFPSTDINITLNAENPGFSLKNSNLPMTRKVHNHSVLQNPSILPIQPTSLPNQRVKMQGLKDSNLLNNRDTSEDNPLRRVTRRGKAANRNFTHSTAL